MILACCLVSPSLAEEQGSSPSDPLSKTVEQLRPRVRALESREAAPTAEEMAQIEPYTTELETALAHVESAVGAVAEDQPPKSVREARKLLQRVAALDLARRAAELRAAVEALGSGVGPLTEDQVSVLTHADKALDIYGNRTTLGQRGE